MAKRGAKKAYETADAIRKVIDKYFLDCEANGIFPDYAGMRIKLGISERTISNYCTEESDFGNECREIFDEAQDKRESWLVRKMTSDNKAAQGCLNALKQPKNGGYIDRPQNEGGELKITLNLAGVGGEAAFKGDKK